MQARAGEFSSPTKGQGTRQAFVTTGLEGGDRQIPGALCPASKVNLRVTERPCLREGKKGESNRGRFSKSSAPIMHTCIQTLQKYSLAFCFFGFFVVLVFFFLRNIYLFERTVSGENHKQRREGRKIGKKGMEMKKMRGRGSLEAKGEKWKETHVTKSSRAGLRAEPDLPPCPIYASLSMVLPSDSSYLGDGCTCASSCSFHLPDLNFREKIISSLRTAQRWPGCKPTGYNWLLWVSVIYKHITVPKRTKHTPSGSHAPSLLAWQEGQLQKNRWVLPQKSSARQQRSTNSAESTHLQYKPCT